MAASEVFHNVGINLFVDIIRGATSVPATLYLGLRTLDGVSGHPTDAVSADTLTSNLAEVSGGGYARIAITFNGTNFTKSQSTNTTVLTGPVETFNFTGTLNGLTHYFLSTSSDNSGTLVFSAPLSNTFNVANGSVLNVTPTMNFVKA